MPPPPKELRIHGQRRLAEESEGDDTGLEDYGALHEAMAERRRRTREARGAADTPTMRLCRIMWRAAWRKAGRRGPPAGLVLVGAPAHWCKFLVEAAQDVWPGGKALLHSGARDADELGYDAAAHYLGADPGRTLILVTQYAAVSASRTLGLAADSILVVPPPSWAMLRLLARWQDGRSPRMADPVHEASGLSPQALVLLWRGGRSGAESLALCAEHVALDAAESDKPPQGPAARERAAREKPAPTAPVPAERLEDLPGLGEAATWGRRLAVDLADYRAGRLPWSDVDGGLLLSGPPGTGKTSFALALAGECGVPLVAGSLAQWQAAGTGHLGDLLKAMRGAFKEAQAKAPCILFIDEADSVGNRATFSSYHRDYYVQVVNGLLECLSGLTTREGVVVLAATNYPDDLDPALRRAGRLDRHIALRLPDAEAREAILRLHLGAAAEALDLREAARALEGASGADLEQIARDGRRLARDGRRPVRASDVLRASAALRGQAATWQLERWDASVVTRH